MLHIVRDVTRSKLLIADAILSIIFALSPILIKLLIYASYSRADVYGNGADPFMWFFFAMCALGGYVTIQAVCFIAVSIGSPKSKLFILFSSTLLWIISIISLRIL